jgi:hypothetical protein
MPQAKFAQPTTWILAGDDIQIRYSVAGPNLHYQDSQQTLDFTGNDIRAVDVPDVGTLVSVTIVLTVDSGSTTLTVLLPRVNLPAPPALPAAVPVATNGIATTHHFSVVPAFQHGQQDFYNIIPLTGLAV